ncbi:hypothetical protein RRG08_027311 [Elysia crispata]|uniref:Uncharacterized protein n=1 Tax=Elysia crispata TaxID=231223 RepID=A0AAE0Z9Q0_9GAST|nr:hypothetical protein RRG08_027311 [Elysia crispata]
MSDFDYKESSHARADADVARGALNDDIPLKVYTPINAAGGIADTSFSTPTGGVKNTAYAEWMTLEQKPLATAVDDYYDAMAERGIKTSLGRDINNFELGPGARLRLKNHPKVNIINTRTGAPNTLDYVASKIEGGRSAVREYLGFSKWNPDAEKQGLSPDSNAEINRGEQQMSKAASNIESAPLEDSGQGANEAVKGAEKILAVFVREGYTSRDILGMLRALERSRGEHTNNLAKLSELDEHLAKERRKLEEAPDEATKDRIAKRLRELQDERAARLEAASATKEALRSQISRIRETLHRILHEDKTLAERIRTLFQGKKVAKSGLPFKNWNTRIKMLNHHRAHRNGDQDR